MYQFVKDVIWELKTCEITQLDLYDPAQYGRLFFSSLNGEQKKSKQTTEMRKLFLLRKPTTKLLINNKLTA